MKPEGEFPIKSRMISRSRDMLTISNENKRRKKEEASPLSFGLLDSLPDAVAISCFALLSRLDLASLSLVSKRYASLVASPELYTARSLMGCTEKNLYMCLGLPPDPTPRWFILRPTRDAAAERTVNLAHPIPSCPSQPPEGSAVVALDWGIYVIGGLVNSKRTSGVLLLDCRSHKWHHVTSMGVARASAVAHVVDGKIYVLGGCKESNLSDCGEVFDPKTQTWDALPIPKLLLDPVGRSVMNLIHDSVVIEGKIYVMHAWNTSFYYSPSQGEWGIESRNLNPRNYRDLCVIDKVIYSCGKDGLIYWCDAVGTNWREVAGWELFRLKLPLTLSRVAHFGGKMARAWESYKKAHSRSATLEDLLPGARLIKFGQNIVVFWDKLVRWRRYKKLEIWCAQFSLSRCSKDEILSTLHWSNAIFTVDPLLCELCRSKVLYSHSVDV